MTYPYSALMYDGRNFYQSNFSSEEHFLSEMEERKNIRWGRLFDKGGFWISQFNREYNPK